MGLMVAMPNPYCKEVCVWLSRKPKHLLRRGQERHKSEMLRLDF